ncbi:glycosyltransferase family 25 protein [Vibrio cholerae]|nr:glycosyltransferase family 25 protein [Vibrio cholerae]
MKFACYVLSLFDQYDRRESIIGQLEHLLMNYEIIDAVDFRSVSLEKKRDFVKKNDTIICRELVNGEVGCSLSHFKCYKKLLVDNVDWALIIEDDADLGRLKLDTIEGILAATATSDIDVIILGYSKLKKTDESLFYRFEPVRKIINVNNVILGKPWRNWTCGTVTYLIRKPGAKKMLDYFSDGKAVTVADDWQFFEEQVGLNIVHCRPLLVFEDFSNFQSALESDRSKVSNKTIKFLNPVRVLRGYLRLLLMKLKP